MLMNLLRKIAVFIATSLLTFLLFSTVTATTLATIINPGNIKNWLNHSGIYYGAVDAILDSAAGAKQKETGDDLEIFSSPEMQKAVKVSFPPGFLQGLAEDFIDGNFAWLEGKSDEPNFKIDLTKAKKNLAKNIVGSAVTRYKSLPVCKTMPSADTDPLSATCRVPGYDFTADAKKAEKELASDKNIFGNPPILTAGSLTLEGGDGKKQPYYERLSFLPSLYGFLKFAPFIFGILSAGAILVLVFMSSERRRGIRRATVALLVSAGLLLASAWIIKATINSSKLKLADAGSSTAAFMQKTALSIGNDIGSQLIKINLYFGIAFALIGGGLLIILVYSNRGQNIAKENEIKTTANPKLETKESPPKPKN